MLKTKNSNYELDDYGQEIEKGLEKGDFKRVPNFEQEMSKLRAAARATLAKTKNINIRISQADLFKVRLIAEEQGIPYQTLISSLIHQYSRGRIDYNVLRKP